MSAIAPLPSRSPTPSVASRRVAGADRAARALYLLATALGLSCIGLAVWGWRVGRQLDDQLAHAARAQAELLAREFSELVQARTNAAAERVFAPLSILVGPFTRPHLSLLRRSVEEAVACRCVTAIPVTDGVFAWNSSQPAELLTEGLPDILIVPMHQRILALTREATRGQTAAVMLQVDEEGRELLAPVLVQERGGLVRVIGLLTRPDEMAAARFQPTALEVQEGRFGAAAPGIVGWRVIIGGEDTVVRLGNQAVASPQVTVAFFRPQVRPGSRVSDTAASRDLATTPYRVSVQVHPAALASHLYGGLPGGPLPIGLILLGALALAVSMLVLARRFLAQVREREVFATAVAHDLRTPLTQILLYGESLQLDRPAAQARHDAARIIVRETRRLIHLVENALQFTGRGGAHPTLQLEGLELSSVIGEVVGALQPVVKKSEMAITFSPAAGTMVRADREAVAQVLTNLIENAVRFGPAGQVIAVGLKVRGAMAELTVDDQGPGIEVAMRDRVFMPFVHDPRSPGAGVGLAVSRQLAELMDGTIAAEAAPSGGARLVLRLPLAAAGTSTTERG
jgi:signal transduction histidine kinase